MGPQEGFGSETRTILVEKGPWETVELPFTV